MDDTRTCTKCGRTKPATEFYKRRDRKNGYHAWCRECLTASRIEWIEQNPGRYRKTKQAADKGRYARLTDDEKAREKTRKAAAYLENRDTALQRGRERHEANRAAVFAYYGQRCACCGTTENLQIDHVSGGGKQWHAATFGYRAGAQMVYRWLVRNSFPPGFQTLCGLCNRSKKDSARCRIHQS